MKHLSEVDDYGSFAGGALSGGAIGALATGAVALNKIHGLKKKIRALNLYNQGLRHATGAISHKMPIK